MACGSAASPGYVVLTCAGPHAHAFAPSAHEHVAVEGWVSGALPGGTPSGDFCGAPTAVKAYVVT